MQALFSLQLYYEKTLTQASNLTIFKHVVLWTCQARHIMKYAKHRYFMKHAKHAMLWSTPSTVIYEARQARHFFEARQAPDFMKHANT